MLITYKNLSLFKKSPAELSTSVICIRLVSVLEIQSKEMGHQLQDLLAFI